jgi:tRNA U34 5-methylaminomethyl-2-thiouridine-forming methyltransferase MnmC
MTWLPQSTQDGSPTFFSDEFGEAFHSVAGARTEAFQKYAVVTQLASKAQQGPIRLLDVCYGLGYNTAAALETIWTANPNCQVQVHALEIDPTIPLAALAPAILGQWSLPVQQVLRAIAQDNTLTTPTLQVQLHIGDARHTLHQVIASQYQADAIFLDPFSPRRCPQLWTVEFLGAVAKCLAPTGRLATYSRAAAVRSALLAAGLSIASICLETTDSVPHRAHEWSAGTIATWHPAPAGLLSPLEQEHLHTRAAIPLRDPTGQGTATEILTQQQQEQATSSLEPTSQWRRRWGIL